MSDRESDTSRSLSPGEARSPTPQPSRRMSDDGSPKPRSTSRSADSHKSGSHSRRSPPPRSRSRSPKRYRRSYSRGKRYRSRSRSRSPRYDKRRRSRYSRSRSRSYSPSSRRGRSRSPMSSRRRHQGNRENPRTSRCLGIFGLSLYTQERELRDMFSRYGPVDEVNIVYDHQTGRSRGFAFLYMRNLEDAVEARERAAGSEVDGRKIRVDFSITERAHTPTPGIYLGKPTASGYRGGSGGGGGGGYRGRSPSPYYRGRGRYSRSRSRSRSYSPRRY